ncbi:histidinol-phosphatase HisJ family protein [Candidatus Methylacidiphilum infernorum]|uniref:Histidinol-phosphatase n=1 Tax=Methylacidiphilum infernorum (isolate V4) TaxID=481448 RepID=B3DYX9_METI4|nr:histidinol-phosphatase HisJ family protein [Candidatus Methylacidiphilum infernorum]ACD82501.1 Histidinol phosphatase, PHP family [Methylacidiphilum infernorum V4]
MKLIADFHMHPQGHKLQPYTHALLDPWAESCMQKGIVYFCFTDHDRYREGVNFSLFREWKQKYPNLNIGIGIERDNDPLTGRSGLVWVRENWENLDFVLGSVHFIGDWPFDRAGYEEGFLKRPIEEIYRDYTANLCRLIDEGFIDSLAHLDLVKIFNYKPKGKILDYFLPVLEKIKEKDLCLEINAAGLRKPVKEQYPSEEILFKAVELKIPFSIGSDAHSWAEVAKGFPQVIDLLRKLGVKELVVFRNHSRLPLAL